MSTLNVMARELAAKIVFYGPGLSGKTTTLKRIHDTVKPECRGEMMSLPTEADRTLFFDFLPVKVERVGDCAVRLALYTVPGQVFYNATRRLVLQGADGVVFVADSQPEAIDSNCESLNNLEDNLLEQGIRLEMFPLVIQYNKRDLTNALSVNHLRGLLNPRRVPDFETCAKDGRGVLDGLKAITRLVIKDLRDKRVMVRPSRPTVPESRAPAMVSKSQSIMQEQVNQQLEAVEVATIERAPAPRIQPPTQPPLPSKPREPAPTLGARRGLAASLAPEALLDYARAVDLAWISDDFETCVRACHEAARRALGYAGEGSMSTQGYLLGVDGADLLRLLGMTTRQQPGREEASFAVYLLLQVFVRLNASGLASH